MADSHPDPRLADCCSAFASTRPSPLPATRSWHRAADQLLAASRPQLLPLFILFGVAASLASARLDGGLRMLPLAAYFLAAGGWCLCNFARCREAHCVVTGFGWTALSALVLAAAVEGNDGRNAAWLAFFIVLLGGILFEIGWATVHGSTAVRG